MAQHRGMWGAIFSGNILTRMRDMGELVSLLVKKKNMNVRIQNVEARCKNMTV